jgi:hypothetical protein
VAQTAGSLTDLGPYLTSRLLGAGFELPFDPSCMYALADAVKSVSLVDLLRWRFVCLKLLPQSCDNTSLQQLLNQVDPVLEALVGLSSIASVEYEHSFLASVT